MEEEIIPQSVEIGTDDFNQMMQDLGIADPVEQDLSIPDDLEVTPIINREEIVEAAVTHVEALVYSSEIVIIDNESIRLNGENTPTPIEEEEVVPAVTNPTIPENSETFLVSDTRLRFSGAVWAEKMKEQKVILAGVGGIGSWLGILLGRFGINNLILFDNDLVDTTNLSGQLYSMNQLGVYKTSSLSENIRNFSNFHNVYAYSRRYESDERLREKVMICGFDNMTARKSFYKAWRDKLSHDIYTNPNCNPKEYLFLDGRLAAEELQIFCITGADHYYMEEYEEKYLFNDSEAEATVCSYKQTSFMAAMIGSLMSNLFVNFVTNLCDVPLDRDLPFLTTYQADYMLFKTNN